MPILRRFEFQKEYFSKSTLPPNHTPESLPQPGTSAVTPLTFIHSAEESVVNLVTPGLLNELFSWDSE